MNPARPSYDWVHPVTITTDRYSGVYSGGAWLAFPLAPSDVPEGPFDGDVFAAAWWNEVGNMPIGLGANPSEAYDNLVRRLEAIRPTWVSESASDLSGSSWHWDLRWPTGLVTHVSRHWLGEGRGPQPWADAE